MYETIVGDIIRRNGFILSTSLAFSCLGNPALPCTSHEEQVLRWTQERKERQERGRKKRVMEGM